MNSKKLNLIEIFLHIGTILLLFVRGMFICFIEKPYEADAKVYNAFSDLPNMTLPIIFVVLLVLNTLLCIGFALSKKKEKLNVLHTVLPIVSAIIFCVIGVLYSAGEYATLVEQLTVAISDGSSSYSVGAVFFVELIVLVLICIVAINKKKRFCEDANEENNLEIISQEEFEAKKKEILAKDGAVVGE